MKFSAIILLLAGVDAMKSKTSTNLRTMSSFAPPSLGPYAKDTDHLSTECYGADEDDIMYDVFERYRVEEKNPNGCRYWNLEASKILRSPMGW